MRTVRLKLKERQTNMIRFLFFFLCFGQQATAQKDIDSLLQEFESDTPLINSYCAMTKMNDSLVFFLDAREKDEYNTSHIKGAIHVGYDRFSHKAIKTVPKNAEVIVYCSLGYRSDEIAQKLKRMGYKNVTNLFGGLFQWSNRAYPLVNGKEQSTTMIHGYSKSWSQYIHQGTIVY